MSPEFWAGFGVGVALVGVIDLCIVAFLAWEYTRGRGPKT